MNSSDQPYDIFLSYARLDNAPIPPDAPIGWVTALRDHILADHRRFSTEPLRIFFDTDEIKDMDDWRHRILGALRRSRILLVCLSPNYFKSEPCRWEWDEYLRRQVHKLIGSESIACVYFVEVPGSDEKENARRLDELMRGNFTDIRPWYPEGAAALEREEVQRRMAALGASLHERIERARLAFRPDGNLRRMTPYFVGRNTELRALHENLAKGAVGVVTAVQGLGGQGKTELAVAYAYGWADLYRAGLWVLAAENKKELLPLIGELAWEPALGFTPTEAERNDPALLGRAVLAHLQKRVESLEAEAAQGSERGGRKDAGAAALVLLDNVSEPSLLSPAQLAALPRADWLHIAATTRLDIKPVKDSLALLEVDSLDEEDALALIREHQPPRDPEGLLPGFESQAEEAAARELARELGSFTLAVEQVAVYLGLHPEITPSAFLAGMRAKGLPGVDDIPKRDPSAAEQILHQEKQLAVILGNTIAGLDAPSRTALQFAALLPPDAVPWPWLRALTEAEHPELRIHAPDEPDRWIEVRRRLAGLRLLTPGDHREMARIHRLIAAHVSPTHDKRRAVEAHLTERADWIDELSGAPPDWELDAVQSAVPFLLAAPGEGTAPGDLAYAAVFVSDKFVTYRTLPAALSLIRPAHEVLARLAASDPGNAQLQRDLSDSLERLGGVAVAVGDLAGARERFEQGMRIRESLAASDPGNAQLQRDLSVSHNKLGDVAVALGDLAGARESFKQGMRIRESLAASDPGNAQWQRDLSVSLERLGEVAIALGDLAGARESFEQGMRIHGRLAASDRGNAQWQRDLTVSCIKLGRIAVALGDLPGAAGSFEQGLRIAERLAASDPGNAQWQRDLAISLDSLGDVAVALGDLAGARGRFDQGMRIAGRLAASDPGNTQWQRDLSISYIKLGEVAVAVGDLRGARGSFEAGMRIRERLAASDPGNAQWQRDLFVSCWKMASLLESANEPARTWWRRAHDTLAAMETRGMHLSPQDEASLAELRAKVGA